jgi:hypothetical protein
MKSLSVPFLVTSPHYHRAACYRTHGFGLLTTDVWSRRRGMDHAS